MINTKTVLIGLAAITLSASALADLSTSIEIENTTSSDERLINGSNVSGTISPSVPFILAADSTTNHVSTTPGDIVDAGVITYRSCRFNWSTIKTGSIYTFSTGATPSSSCDVDVLVQNIFTGEHNLKFSIK